MSKTYENVIVALDFEFPEQAYAVVDEIGDAISWYKVGPTLFTRSGNEIIQFLHRRNKRIFLDLKLHDTPNVVSNTVKQIADMGVQLTTLHLLGGRTMLEAAGTHCRGSQLKLLGVTLLTSQRVSETKEYGWAQTDNELVLNLVDLALETRLAGIICSPHEIQTVRTKALPGFLLVTPGIRIPGEEVFMDDQKRVASPREAVDWGADYLVIGRPITSAREPLDAINRLFEK